MPKIPVYSSDVQPAESSKPFIRDYQDVGRTESAWQGGLAQVGKRAEQYQNEQDALNAAEALSALNDRERQHMDSALKQEGRNAVGSVQRGSEFYEKSIRDIGGNLRGNASRMFHQQALQTRDSGLNRLSSHEANQHQKRKMDALSTTVEGIRTKIRNGADQETIHRDVMEGPLSLMGQIDAELAGFDNTEIKTKLRDQIFSEYLDQVSVKNPDGIVDAVGKWHGIMDTETLNKYLKKVDMANAITSLNADPDNFRADKYASLDPVQQANLQEQAIRLSESRLNKKVALWDREERIREREERKQRDNNEIAALILYHNGKLSIGDIQEMGLRRKLDPAAVKYFMNKDQEGYNDPMIVGEIAEMVEQKIDASDMMRQALFSKKIKVDTYIGFKKQIGSDKYWKGITKLKGALEPGQLDKFDADRNLKWAEGFDYFNRLVTSGVDAEIASQQVIDGHYNKITRSASSLPKPVAWQGGADLLDLNAIGATITATYDKFRNRELSDAQFEHELDLLRKLNKAAEEISKQKYNASQGANTPVKQPDRAPEKKRPAK